MNLLIWDEAPVVDTSKGVIFYDSDFIELKPIMDMCRVHNKTLMIVFNDEKTEQ